MEVQIFGIKKSTDTWKALRFLEDRWLEKLLEEPLLLRLPLVRNASQLVIGADEEIWRS
jgi:arsenate reductase-like glutaredoxin family protein